MAGVMSKRWCATVFSDDWVPTFDGGVIYAVWQRERCPETGRVHVHVYVRYPTRKRMETVKNLFRRPDMHLEAARGSEEECRAYCQKAESRIEEGTEYNVQNYDPNEGKQGRRSDLDAIAVQIRENVPIALIAENHPADYIRYHAGIQALHMQIAPRPPIMRDVEVLILWGATGVGKTHRIMTRFPECYCVKPGRDPWGRYRGEDTVFFDEFDWTKWTVQEMNRYLDKWRVLLDARYHDVYGAWTRVAICANDSPVSWYNNQSWPLIQAFRRRIQTSSYLVQDQNQAIEDMEQTPNFGPANTEIHVAVDN